MEISDKFLAKYPNFLGEYLRDLFWDQDHGGIGCYTTFNLRENVVALPSAPVVYFDGVDDHIEEDHVWNRYSLKGIVMQYYWDGDGSIEFHLPNGVILSNNDCKKDYTWEWLADN